MKMMTILTQENLSTSRQTCPSATLFPTNQTWTGLELTPGFCSDRPATNQLRHGIGPHHLKVLKNHLK